MAEELTSIVGGNGFPARPDFPKLKAACDPALMLETFRTHLKPVSGKACHIEECIPVRFRWRKDGSRCVLQYLLQLVETGSGRRCHSWVSGVIYRQPGRTEQAWAELKAELPLRRLPETLLTFEPLVLIAEFPMLVQVFPYDRQLTTLPLVMGGPGFELQQPLLACFGPGPWQIEEQNAELLRYRAEVGAVVRYTLQGRNALTLETQTKRFFLKVYSGRHGQQTFDLLRQLCGRTGAAQNGFSVAKPIVYCAERRCLVLEEAAGRSLQDVFLNGEEADAITAARCVARAVAAFNRSDIPAVRRHSPQEQVVYLVRAATLLRWACPGSGRLIEEIVNEVGARLVEVPFVPIHWDLKTDHIFLDEGRVIFVDLDTVALGDPARDPAHLSAHIACRIGLSAMPAELARSALRAFVEEYFDYVPPHWRQQFILQYATAILESACGVFKRQETHWRETVPAAIDEARRALSTGVV